MFVECRAGRRARVTLHSYIERGETSEEKSEPLKERYQGIYNREFVLFYGEKLHYYFVIEKDGKVETTGEEILTVEESSMQGSSKYQMLNTMLQLREKEKRGTAAYGRSLYGTGAAGKRPVCFIGLGGREILIRQEIL